MGRKERRKEEERSRERGEMGETRARVERASQQPEGQGGERWGGSEALPVPPASLPCNVGRVYLTRSSRLSH